VTPLVRGLIRTITLEIKSDVDERELSSIESILNERLSGLRFSEIRATFRERISDYDKEELKPIIRVFLDSVDKVFANMPREQ
jgi:transcriptional regulator of heat shock response